MSAVWLVAAAASSTIAVHVPSTNPYNDAPGPCVDEIAAAVLIDDSTYATGSTDATGTVVFTDIPAGTITIEFPNHPFVSGSSITVTPGTVIEFTAKWIGWTGGQGTGCLRAEDMKPLPAEGPTSAPQVQPPGRFGLATTGAAVIGIVGIGLVLILLGLMLRRREMER